MLFSLPPEVEVQVCNTNTCVSLKRSIEVINHNRCGYGLARSWDAGTEQCLLVLVYPILEFVRFQQPFPSSFLSSSDEVTLQRGIVGWGEPVQDSLMLLIML